MNHDFLDSPGPIAFAHRGGGSDAENGLSAFRAAADLGYRYIETDVRASSDNVAFIFHDQNLVRMTGLDRNLAQLHSDEVRALSLPGGDKIPTLREALTAFPRLRFNLDLKEDAVVEPVVRTIAELEVQKRVCVTSFSERRIGAVRKRLGSELCTGLGIAGAFKVGLGSVFSCGKLNMRGEASVLQVPLRWNGLPVLNSSIVKRIQNQGLALHVWTLNEQDEIEHALDIGVDGVMTDKPRLLKQILVWRDLWMA